MQNAEWKEGSKNSKFHIPNSEFGSALASGPQTGFLAEKAIAKLKGSNPEFSP